MKAFFKKIDIEGPGNISLEWLGKAQDTIVTEFEKDKSCYPSQLQLQELQSVGKCTITQ